MQGHRAEDCWNPPAAKGKRDEKGGPKGWWKSGPGKGGSKGGAKGGFGGKGKGLYSLEGVLASIQGPPAEATNPWAGPNGWAPWTGYHLTLEEPNAEEPDAAEDLCDMCMADWPTVSQACAPDFSHGTQYDALRDDDDDFPPPLMDSEDEGGDGEETDDGMTPDDLIQMVLEIHSDLVGATMSALECSEEDAAAEVLTDLANNGKVPELVKQATPQGVSRRKRRR